MTEPSVSFIYTFCLLAKTWTKVPEEGQKVPRLLYRSPETTSRENTTGDHKQVKRDCDQSVLSGRDAILSGIRGGEALDPFPAITNWSNIARS